jgi:oligopeptide/dipeptide ABC transporter ATP-binding protein
MTEPLVEIRSLTKYFTSSFATARVSAPVSRLFGTQVEDGTPVVAHHDQRTLAVDDFNLTIEPGEVVGLVGESGSGKSTVARCLLRLTNPSAGEIRFEGQSIVNLRGSELKGFRQKAQMVFQDPTASLDPRFTVERTLTEPLRVHRIADGDARRKRIHELMEAVHLRQDHLKRHPHQLSGGEKQRVVIARALATNPRFLVLDEPTSALDASVQTHIINLLKELRGRYDMTYLVISHDLSVIRHLCQRVIVMYLGRVIEAAPTEALINRPQHPYTQALMSAIPIPDPDYARPRIRLKGDIGDSSGARDRCPLAVRCHKAVEACHHTPQQLIEIEESRWVACHRVSSGEI